MPHDGDLAWEADLAAEVQRRRLDLQPTFLATDEDVVILRPSDPASTIAA